MAKKIKVPKVLYVVVGGNLFDPHVYETNVYETKKKALEYIRYGIEHCDIPKGTEIVVKYVPAE